MRELIRSEQDSVAGGEELLPAPPPQSPEEIGSLLDQVRHLNGRAGTY